MKKQLTACLAVIAMAAGISSCKKARLKYFY